MTDKQPLDKEDYAEWWKAQFPCECGHSPDSHFLAPQDGTCLACMECHGEGGAIIRLAQSVTKAMEEEG